MFFFSSNQIIEQNPHKKFICVNCVNDLHVAFDFKQRCERQRCQQSTATTVKIENNSDTAKSEPLEEDGQENGYEFEYYKDYETDDNKLYECDVCQRKFTSKGFILTHLHRHLNKKRQFRCNKCGSRFLVRPQFKNHSCIKQTHKKTQK